MKSHFWIGAGSLIWSSVNRIRRIVSRSDIVRLPAKVISIGNLQAGGSGKTPTVLRIAREAIERNLKVAILIRGYRSEWETEGGVISPHSRVDVKKCGDEAALLHEYLPDLWIGVGKDRIRSFERCIEKSGSNFDLVLLDDGFSQLAIHKDLEIVLLTSRSRSQVLYRDFLSALKGNELLVWTKGNTHPAPDLTCIQAQWKLVEKEDRTPATPVFLVTGVGDPGEVDIQARKAGWDVHGIISREDHHDWTQEEILEIMRRAEDKGVSILITGKDYVKWKIYPINLETVFVIEAQLNFSEESERFWKERVWGKS